MKQLLILLLALPACTMGPVATSKGVSLGGTIFTKSDGLYAKYDGPFGKMEYGTVKNDETIIPSKISNYYGLKAAIGGTVAALRTTESTKRVLSGHEVQKTGIKSAAEVEKLKILNPIEEEIPLTPAP